MSTHQRETILAAAKTAIVNAATSMSTRVYRGRKLPVENAELPAALIYQGPEDARLNDVNSLKLRALQAFVELHQDSAPASLNAPDIETKLNALALEVENALEADPSLGGTCLWIEHNGGEEPDIEAGEYVRGALRLRFTIHYRTQRTDASVAG